MTSTIITRSWLSAVVWIMSIDSVAVRSAVSNPNVISVASRSLSIVFGTPMTGNPASRNLCPIVRVPSPPIRIIASNFISRNLSMTVWE
jgi:hypothetical protein